MDTTHPPVRVAAASLAFNIAAHNHSLRVQDQPDSISEADQVELMAGLFEAMGKERESKEGLRGLLLAAGLLTYRARKESELMDLCQVVGAKDLVGGLRGMFKELNDLVREVEQVMP